MLPSPWQQVIVYPTWPPQLSGVLQSDEQQGQGEGEGEEEGAGEEKDSQGGGTQAGCIDKEFQLSLFIAVTLQLTVVYKKMLVLFAKFENDCRLICWSQFVISDLVVLIPNSPSAGSFKILLFTYMPQKCKMFWLYTSNWLLMSYLKQNGSSSIFVQWRPS